MDTVVKDKIVSNPFISLVNFRMRQAQNATYREQFADLNSEPYRLQHFISVKGITFVDDTKAQSVNAIWYSLESLKTQVTLIVKDIENIQELLSLKSLLMLKVKSIVFLQDKKEYLGLLQPIVSTIHSAKTMDEAVQWAYLRTEKQDAIMFSAGVKVSVEKESQLFRDAVRKL